MITKDDLIQLGGDIRGQAYTAFESCDMHTIGYVALSLCAPMLLGPVTDEEWCLCNGGYPNRRVLDATIESRLASISPKPDPRIEELSQLIIPHHWTKQGLTGVCLTKEGAREILAVSDKQTEKGTCTRAAGHVGPCNGFPRIVGDRSCYTPLKEKING